MYDKYNYGLRQICIQRKAIANCIDICKFYIEDLKYWSAPCRNVILYVCVQALHIT